jgi:serine/threonine protein kinase
MSRTEVYGRRWKKEPGEKAGEGGQAQVFKVRAVDGNPDGIFALKRVTNSNRRGRFINEVESIKRLNHPNIITIIDHSSLDEAAVSEKQYIVMPFAAGGSLSKRKQIYKNNIAATLEIALLLAGALDAAHSAKVIHRDVKPDNILFRGDDNHVLLADFGIAFLEDYPRYTGDGEVVGPAHYIAPELERTGQKNVTTAADVYSLGKVIYFILSGGEIIRREALHEPQYAAIFDQGQQFRLLQGLLHRMICALPSRISTMQEVIDELSRIASWPLTAQLPIPPEALAALDKLRGKNIDVQIGRQRNAEIVEQRKQLSHHTRSALAEQVRGTLEALANMITDGNGLKAGVRQTGSGGDAIRLDRMRTDIGVEIWVRNEHERNNLEHVLRFSMCHAIVYEPISFEPQLSVPKVENIYEDIFIIPSYKMDIADGVHRGMFWDYFDESGNIFHSAEFPSVKHQSICVNTKDHGLEAERVAKLVSDCSTKFIGRLQGTP